MQVYGLWPVQQVMSTLIRSPAGHGARWGGWWQVESFQRKENRQVGEETTTCYDTINMFYAAYSSVILLQSISYWHFYQYAVCHCRSTVLIQHMISLSNLYIYNDIPSSPHHLTFFSSGRWPKPAGRWCTSQDLKWDVSHLHQYTIRKVVKK